LSKTNLLRDLIKQQSKVILDAMQSKRKQMIEDNLFHPIVDDMARFMEKHIGKTLERFQSE
jgi:hypothetical protein